MMLNSDVTSLVIRCSNQDPGDPDNCTAQATVVVEN